MEDVLAALHVLGAVFIIGPMAILPMTAARAVRSGDGRQVAGLARSTWVFSLLSLLVVVLGFGVLGMSKYGTTVTTPWVLISLVLYVIALAVSLFVLVPAMRGAAQSLGAPAARAASGAVLSAPGVGSVSAESVRAAGSGRGSGGSRGAYQRITMSSGISSVLLVAVVVLMVIKP